MPIVFTNNFRRCTRLKIMLSELTIVRKYALFLLIPYISFLAFASSNTCLQNKAIKN